MSKAGKASDAGVTSIGVEHPSPDTIPHLSSASPHNGPNGTGNNNGLSLQPTQSHGQAGGTSGSPVKESSFLHRGMSVDEGAGNPQDDEIEREAQAVAVSPGGEKEGMPIRQ